jgi:cell division protease FtsH
MFFITKADQVSLDSFIEKEIASLITNPNEQYPSYFDKVKNVIRKKLDYLQSNDGVSHTVDTAISFIYGGFSLIASVYVVSYIQQTIFGAFSDNKLMHIYYPGQIKIKFSDVVGLAGAKSDMYDIISYLNNSEKYKKLGATVPRGVLMEGEPGNGKTYLAKAVAGESNCPFISVNGSSFVQMFIGTGAARVRNLFKKARELGSKYGACIIFIDEIDSLASKRGAFGGREEHDQTINALLAEMDGLDVSGAPVIILGATNRAALLDEAVVRPGRFDRIVTVTKPALKDRIEFFHIALQEFSQVSKIDIDIIARATAGFSAAELKNLVNEAAILAANDSREVLEMMDIELAFDNITLGREIMGMDQNDEDKWKTAIHEAGHTIALILLDKKNMVHKSSIIPRSNHLGVTRMLPLHESYNYTEEDMQNQIIVALAGRIAEEEFGMGLNSGAISDLQRVHEIAYNMVARYGMSDALRNVSYEYRDYMPSDIANQVEREIQKIINNCTQIGKTLINNHRLDIEKIARLMMDKGTVLGNEIYNLLKLPMPNIDFSLLGDPKDPGIQV